MKAIVLAGGGGTRLWPISKDNFPKQFLNFGFGHSLLQKTVLRLKNAPFIDDVLVSTNELHQSLVKEQLNRIGMNCTILVEPYRRNTAPAIALAVKTLQAKEDDLIVVVPSDHLIEPESIFLNALENLNPKNKIVTFGIRPTKPETGYGYIEIGRQLSGLTFQVKRFVEKPSLEIAQKYVNNPHFFWNAGIFLFRAKTFWDQLELHAPFLSHYFQKEDAINHFYEMSDLSIDYAIMEKSKDVIICPLAISWSDLGCWDSVYEVLEKDENQNVKIGEVFAIDTKNSLIISNKRIISTIGLDDLIIIETDDAILISKKGESQRVKALLQQLKNRV